VSSLKREAKPKSTVLWRIDKPIARANIGTVAVEGEGGSSMTMLGSSRLTFFLKLLGASAFVFVLVRIKILSFLNANHKCKTIVSVLRWYLDTLPSG